MSEWSVVIPVRGWATGKSRLGIPGVARAMVIDTIAALAACPDVAELIVVTGDGDVRADLASGSILVVNEPPGDLNESIAEAAQLRQHTSCAVVLGDLPCLRAQDMSLALSRCRESPHFISDAHGTGSTMWFTLSGDVVTHFGERSRARHRYAGAVELEPHPGDEPAAWARLRRDVDDDVDLADAARLGLGPQTSGILESRRAAEGRSSNTPHT